MIGPVRCILLVAMSLALGFTAVAEQALPDAWRVYIGTYTRGDSEGIYQLSLDAEDGTLALKGLAAKTENPSFLALHPEKPILYAAGEMSNGGTVSAFSIDGATGALAAINAESSGGSGPCHVTVAPSGKHVAVANYGGGSVSLLPIDDAGALSAATATIQHSGSSVNPKRQQGPHAHSVNFDPAGRFLFAADLGIDKMMIYRYGVEDDSLTANDPAFAALTPGAGPRHFSFHPSGDYAYAVNELDSTVTVFRYVADAGRLETVQTINTLPDQFEDSNTTAEIRVHPSGDYVYASNRGHDSIAAFRVDPGTGRLTAIGHCSTEGKTPRNFNIDPAGRFLVSANQNSGNVVVLAIDPEDGTLSSTGHQIALPMPVCVTFVPADHPARALMMRSVELTYGCLIEDIPEGAETIDLWMPVASDTDGQRVTMAEAVWPNDGSIGEESRYGNRMFHKRFTAPFDSDRHDGELGAELRFEIHREEIEIPEAKVRAKVEHAAPATELYAYLGPNRLIPVDGPIETLAKELALDQETPIHAARKIYDYLIDEMTYDWRAEGGGQGDVLWACDSKTGDCSDYHSMFIALCRNQGIPADHEFGFPMRSGRDSGRIPSYHCWARFHVDGIGWIPIDASEADKHPELREYNFGSLTANLLKFSHGRDVVLEPPQQGPPLNRFIYPYVEINGKPHENIKFRVAYQII